MCFATAPSLLPAHPSVEARRAAREARRARIRLHGRLRWWWRIFMDPEFRRDEVGLIVAAEIQALPPALRPHLFHAEVRRLQNRHHRWAAENWTDAECAILRNLTEEEFQP